MFKSWRSWTPPANLSALDERNHYANHCYAGSRGTFRLIPACMLSRRRTRVRDPKLIGLEVFGRCPEQHLHDEIGRWQDRLRHPRGDHRGVPEMLAVGAERTVRRTGTVGAGRVCTVDQARFDADGREREELTGFRRSFALTDKSKTRFLPTGACRRRALRTPREFRASYRAEGSHQPASAGHLPPGGAGQGFSGKKHSLAGGQFRGRINPRARCSARATWCAP
jgi:hypothetical protein